MIFPKSENEVYELANIVLNGVTTNPGDFPGIDPIELSTVISNYSGSKNSAESARAQSKIATVSKKDSLSELETYLKNTLKKAEIDCQDDPEKLSEIGWGPRSNPTPLAMPGQCGFLTAYDEAAGSLKLKWNKPTTGGAPSIYRIERSDQPEGGGIPGPWKIVNTFYKNDVQLEDQPRGIEMQYRVIATNAAGDGIASNIATVVL